MTKTAAPITGTALLVVGLVVGFFGATLFVEDPFDAHLDSRARVAVQKWAHDDGKLSENTRIETVLQFPTCSTFDLYTTESTATPMVAVLRGDSWVASPALNHTNDADDIHDEKACVARATA